MIHCMWYSRLSHNGHFYKTDTSVKLTPSVVPAFLYYLYLALCKTEISLRQTLSGGPKEGLRRQLTVLVVCTWRQGGHIGDQGQKHFSPLGTKLYFQVNSSRKNFIVLTPNMSALSRGCKPRICFVWYPWISKDCTPKGHQISVAGQTG